MAMASKFRKLLSFTIDSRSSDIVNNNEFRAKDLVKSPSPDNFYKWDIPKVNIKTITKLVHSALKLLCESTIMKI